MHDWPSYTFFYNSLLFSPPFPSSPAHPHGFTELYIFCTLPVKAHHGSRLITCKVQVDHPGSGACSLIAYQIMKLGGLLLAIVSLFALLGLCQHFAYHSPFFTSIHPNPEMTQPTLLHPHSRNDSANPAFPHSISYQLVPVTRFLSRHFLPV